MSLTKPPKKSMREYYLKPPAKGSTTAYICRQFYDRELRRTVQTLVASFNIATNPVMPEVNITDKGRAAGYVEVPPDHLAEVQRWLKKHGTFGKTKVPTAVLQQLRKEVEDKLRAELDLPKSRPAIVEAPARRKPQTLPEAMRLMCSATEEFRAYLAGVKTGGAKVLGFTEADLFELRIHLNFTEKTVRKMLKLRGISARDYPAKNLPTEAAEATRRGIIDAQD